MYCLSLTLLCRGLQQKGGVSNEWEGYHMPVCKGTEACNGEGKPLPVCGGCHEGAVGISHVSPQTVWGGSDQPPWEKQDHTHTQGWLPADEVPGRTQAWRTPPWGSDAVTRSWDAWVYQGGTQHRHVWKSRYWQDSYRHRPRCKSMSWRIYSFLYIRTAPADTHQGGQDGKNA